MRGNEATERCQTIAGEWVTQAALDLVWHELPPGVRRDSAGFWSRLRLASARHAAAGVPPLWGAGEGGKPIGTGWTVRVRSKAVQQHTHSKTLARDQWHLVLH